MRRFKQAILCLAIVVMASSVTVAWADVFNMPDGETSLQFVSVGDAGNAADTNGHGSVGYTYQMGKYDVTLGQYCQFLNAVAKADPYGLYAGAMAGEFATLGIARSGSSGSYSYTVTGSYSQAANCPIFYVTWGDAVRLCNWLQNGQPARPEGDGTTETGAYTLNGAVTTSALMAVTRNAGATYFLPSEDEWYKAAYYKGGSINAGYWLYPTQSNAMPSNVLSATGTNNANFYNGVYTDPVNLLTPVGAFADSPGPYGTYDMAGNVLEWEEVYKGASARGLRGGSFYGSTSIYMASSHEYNSDPTFEDDFIGFRVAEAVPEPGSIAMLVAGAMSLLAYAWRRRAKAA